MWATKEQVSICYSDAAGFPFSAGIISSLNFTLNCLSYVLPEVHSDRAVDFCSKNCACVPKVLLQLSLSSSSSMAVDHRYSSRCPTAQDWFPQFAQVSNIGALTFHFSVWLVPVASWCKH